MKSARLVALVVAWTALGCGGGGGGGGGGTTVAGAVKVLNGPTSRAAAPALRAAISAGPAPGTYRLSPATMTMKLTAVGLVPAGQSGNDVQMKMQALSGCTATYDRSAGSLAVLSDCEVSVPTGSFGGVVVQYDTTYTVVVNDDEAGIYSNPDVSGHLTTVKPEGGGKPIQVTDQNTTFGQVTTYFPAPITISEGTTPELYVVFEPTHWMKATLSSGSFSEPSMSGNPPIVPAASHFGKAALYSNIGTTMSYRSEDHSGDANGESLLFLYGDANTPVSVTWQVHDLCSPLGHAPVVAFDGDGTQWGTFGRLGLDAEGTLAWVSPAGFDSTTGVVSGYTGVYSMPALASLGDETTLHYRCTSDVPPLVSGDTYASGAPDLSAYSAVQLRLLED